MKIVVKICGITNGEDARTAVAAGADAVGFNFYEKSPRFLDLAAAAGIARSLPPSVLRVGVFVNAPGEAVVQAISECDLGMLQFHGEEDPNYCQQFGLMCMKAFRIHGRETIEEMKSYNTDAYLLDAWMPGVRGGTGESFDWELAEEAKKIGRPIFLAGGLTPENVAAAIRKVQPFGVDVASGVESYAGKKDPAKVKAFIQAVRSIQ